jgi:hypothetical protein
MRRLAAVALCLGAALAQAPKRAPDVRYEPSPPEVVHAMLKLAWSTTSAAATAASSSPR